MEIGIDEAGRGPVIGPLVVALVGWDDPAPEVRPPIRDSKQLSPQQRRRAARFLRRRCRIRIHCIPAWVIAAQRESMTRLEAQVIREGLAEWDPEPVICDALGSGDGAHRLIQRSYPERRIRFETKADQTHPSVGAASVLAKTVRDRAMERLRSRWGPLGSGYPSDDRTRDWLREWWETDRSWPPFVRTNWSTVRDIRVGVD